MIHTKRECFEQFKATGRLPSPKGVAFAIIDLTQRDEVNLEEITHLIRTDPAIAGRLLKFANTAHRSGRPIVSIGRAVILLGIFRVRQLVLGFSLISDHASGKCPAFNYQAFWSRSLATAIAAQAVAAQAQSASEESFTCGLLSEVGSLALATLFPEEYGEILAAARDQPPAVLLPLEAERFGMDHRELTAALLDDWGLPAIFIDAVYHHEDPAGADFPMGSRAQVLTQALHFASVLGRACMADEPERWHLLPDLYHLGAQLGLERDGVADVFDQVATEWQEWGKVLNVPTRSLPPMAEMAATGPPLPSPRPDEAPLTTFPMRILVASPDEALREQVKAALTDAGHRVATAGSLEETLRQHEEAYPQLAVCDWRPPELDAPALIRALRRREKGHKAYLIALLSPAQEEQLPEVFEAGTDDYLFKPFGAKALLARILAAQRVLHLQEEIQIERESSLRSADEWAHTNRRLLQEALTDPLTRLPNRRYGLDRLAQEWAFAAHSGLPLACLMADIDHFKEVNDRHGHDIGDRVLQQLSEVLLQTTRREDVIFRYGGEEFCVICPATGLEAALQLGERIRAAATAASFGLPDNHFRLTISLGAAAHSRQQASAEALLKQADEALYRAKQAGRNRVAG
jgi:diguanylate cyclase (GGDEF)-like protein